VETTQLKDGFPAIADGAGTNCRAANPYHLTLLFLGTIALSIVLRWISDLTAGPEYGGRFDVPAVNGATWFGFLASIPAVLVVGGFWMAAIDESIDARRRRRGVAGS
jgi:hypothetical protein